MIRRFLMRRISSRDPATRSTICSRRFPMISCPVYSISSHAELSCSRRYCKRDRMVSSEPLIRSNSESEEQPQARQWVVARKSDQQHLFLLLHFAIAHGNRRSGIALMITAGQVLWHVQMSQSQIIDHGRKNLPINMSQGANVELPYAITVGCASTGDKRCPVAIIGISSPTDSRCLAAKSQTAA